MALGSMLSLTSSDLVARSAPKASDHAQEAGPPTVDALRLWRECTKDTDTETDSESETEREEAGHPGKSLKTLDTLMHKTNVNGLW